MLKQLLIIIFVFSWVIGLTQEPIRYTTKQGLPSNHIYDIQEDANGFMWFATNRGLAKFDGENFKIFTIKDGLPNNDTWLLELDYQGRLWYFSKSSYQGYIINDSIYTFQTVDKKVISPRYIFKTKDSLWIFSNGAIQTVKENAIQGANFYKNKDKFDIQFLKVADEYNFEITNTQLINPQTKEIAIIKQNEILFFDWDLNYITALKQQLSKTINNFKIDNRGLIYNNIYFNAFDTGILFINFNKKQSQFIPFNKYVDVESINYFKCKGLENEIQVSIPGHLFLFNYNLDFIRSFSFPELSNNRLSYMDSKGNIWLTNFTQGLTMIPNTQIQSSYYLYEKKTQILGVINDQIIVGINDIGFYKLSKKTNKFEPLAEVKGNSSGRIYKIKSNPNYLISAKKSIKYNSNNSTDIYLKINDGIVKIKHWGFKDIINHKNDTYYINADYLIKETSNQNKIIAKKSGLLQGIVFKNNLFVSGTDGLFQIINDSLIKPLKLGLINVSISSLISTEDHLFIGTDGRGVYSYDNKSIYHIKETDGLSVQRILNQDSVLWLATQQGAQKVSLNRNNLAVSKITDAFYESDGLIQNNTNDIFLQDSFLYAASDMGLAKLNLKNPLYQQTPFIYFSAKNDTLRYMNEERNNVSITFGLQNFVNQEYVNFQYRLLPTQKRWKTTKTKTLNFTHLSPKLYVLEIKAIDQHNNQSISKLYINIIPEWWQTTLAKIGFIGLAILGFLGLIFIIKSQITKKEHTKAQQDKKMASIELQALRSQMNPHFVHNSLNAIQYYIQRNEVELSENYLSKFSQLIRLFFEYSRRQSITIKEELKLLIYYLDIEKLRFEEKFNYSISVGDNIDPEVQKIPSMLLQPIVENAVNHGLFHKKRDGLVSIEFTQINNNILQIIVEDNGIGINQSKTIFNSSYKNYQSNSSAVLKDRLELLNQTKEWIIDYTIEDLSEIELKKTGTIVTLTFR